MTNDRNRLRRWVIQAKLVTSSPMRVRTGEVEVSEQRRKNDEPVETATIATDLDGKPYIPATSLKGVLRAHLIEMLRNGASLMDYSAHVRSLFGDLPTEGELDDGRAVQISRGGCAEFSDARASMASEFSTEVIGRTSIDPTTRAAAFSKLRQGRELCPGAPLDLEVILDRASCEEAALLVRLFTEASTLSFGSGAGSGSGDARLSDVTLGVFGRAEVEAWLARRSDEETSEASAASALSWRTFLRMRSIEDLVVSDAAFASVWADFDKHGKPFGRPAAVDIDLDIHFDGPFILGATEDVEGTEEKGANSKPRQTFTRNGGPVLPGSSVRGALRSCAARIHRIVHQVDPQEMEGDGNPFEVLFGSTARRGAITVSDFLPKKGTDLERRTVEMVAIDRFTGGAAGKLKFAAEVLLSPVFSGRISIAVGALGAELTGKKSPFSPGAIEPPGPAALGLALLVARDLKELDITFGAGRTKGWGGVSGIDWSASVVGAVGDETLAKMLDVLVSSEGADEMKQATCDEALRAYRDFSPVPVAERKADA